MKTGLRILSGLILASSLLASVAAAQDVHTIRIQGGQVYIDDVVVPEHDLPESLDIQNMSARFSFVGDDRAFLDLGGHVYMLEDGQLELVDDAGDAGDLVVFFSSEADGTPVRFMKREGANGFVFKDRDDGTYGFYGNALFDQAKRMEELRAQLMRQRRAEIVESEFEGTVVELTDAAENTARIAEALPRIQFHNYLESIGDRDSRLFEQLKKEQQLELKTHEIAMQIRASGSEDEKRRLTEELRRELETIFALKQQNREREIEQLSERLRELEQRLEQRQELEERIIEARMNELLGRSDW